MARIENMYTLYSLGKAWANTTKVNPKRKVEYLVIIFEYYFKVFLYHSS